MKKLHCLLLFTATLIGISVGGALRYAAVSSKHLESFSEESPRVEKRTEYAAALKDELPRPTFEEVCEAKGVGAAQMLSRYLRDATIDEVLALRDMIAEQEGILPTNLHVKATPDMEEMVWLKWIVEIKGLKLNPKAMLAWARSQEQAKTSLQSLYRWWTLLDPRAALESCLLNDVELKEFVGRLLARGDPEKAYAAIIELWPDSPIMREVEEARWMQFAKRDAKTALSEVMSVIDPQQRKRGLEAVIKGWSERDPLAALRWVENQDSLQEKDALLRVSISAIRKSNPILALKEADKLSPTRGRSGIERMAIEQWAREDQDGALAWLKTQPAGQRRDQMFAAMAPILSKDPEKFFKLMGEMKINPYHRSNQVGPVVKKGTGYSSGGGNNHIFNNYIYGAAVELGKESPEKAFQALYEIGGEDYGSMAKIAKGWIEKNPQEAATWAVSLPENDFSKEAQWEVFVGWSDVSASDAVAFLEKTDFEYSRGIVLELSSRLIPQDPQRALTWAETLNRGDREEVLIGAISSIAEDNPLEGLQLLDRVEDFDSQQRVLRSVTGSWLKEDPSAVMSWLESQPTEAGVDEIMADTAWGWVMERPAEASQWISSMPNGVRRDQAIAGMVNALSYRDNLNKDLESAERWVREINDPALREEWTDELNQRRK